MKKENYDERSSWRTCAVYVFSEKRERIGTATAELAKPASVVFSLVFPFRFIILIVYSLWIRCTCSATRLLISYIVLFFSSILSSPRIRSKSSSINSILSQVAARTLSSIRCGTTPATSLIPSSWVLVSYRITVRDHEQMIVHSGFVQLWLCVWIFVRIAFIVHDMRCERVESVVRRRVRSSTCTPTPCSFLSPYRTGYLCHQSAK
jgi:hypothetical protein